MASFDFVDAAAKSYEFVWRERSYLSRVAVPVLFVKFACVLMIFVSGLQDQHLLGGLVAMPGYIVEAIFMIGVIRYVLYRESIFVWGRTIPAPDSDQKPLLHYGPASRGQCLQAGFAMYLLIKVIQLAMAGTLLDMTQGIDPATQPPPPQPHVGHAIFFLSLMWLSVWTFRLLWLYVPVSMGYPFTKFLKKVQGFNISLSMLATWFICYMPLIILIAGVINIANLIIPNPGSAQILAHSFIEVIGDFLWTLVPMIAMTYGFVEVLSKKPEEPKK